MALSAGSGLGLLMPVHELSSPEDFRKNAEGVQKSTLARDDSIELVASEEGSRKTPPLRGAVCHRCAESRDLWQEELTPAAHGCSVCRQVFHTSHWASHMTRKHRSTGLDLVCSKCKKRGYAVGRYERYQCVVCLEHFGFAKFGPSRSRKKSADTGLVCSTCRTKVPCSKCLRLFGRECWRAREVREHLRKGRKLVCRACQAQGFGPRSLVAYTCRTCGGEFGYKSFREDAKERKNLRKHKVRGMECLQCRRRRNAAGRSICKRCGQYDHLWKHPLGPGTHACSACKQVFEASQWSENLIRQHRSKNRDLVCADCAQRGHIVKTCRTDDYKEYTCTCCEKSWGTGRFYRHMLQDVKRKKGTKLLCKSCFGYFRCDSCHELFKKERWMNCRMSKLVCRDCRAQGLGAGGKTSSQPESS